MYVCMYMYTCMCICMHVCMHVYKHAYVRAHIHTYNHNHTHPPIHPPTHPHTHTPTHTHTHITNSPIHTYCIQELCNPDLMTWQSHPPCPNSLSPNIACHSSTTRSCPPATPCPVLPPPPAPSPPPALSAHPKPSPRPADFNSDKYTPPTPPPSRLPGPRSLFRRRRTCQPVLVNIIHAGDRPLVPLRAHTLFSARERG